MHPEYGMVEPMPNSKYWNDPRSGDGRVSYYSWCLNCGATWNWTLAFYIPVSACRFRFPLCKPCGLVMTDDEILAWLERFDTYTAQFYPHPDQYGKTVEHKKIDLGYARRALSHWRRNRRFVETPQDTCDRIPLMEGPREWSPAYPPSTPPSRR